MTSLRFALGLLLLFSISLAAFDAADYLYPEEIEASITTEDFSMNGADYSIVRINGNENFLLKSGQPLTDEAEISTVIHDYYRETYLPSDEEIEELRDAITAFNESRNNGQKFKGKEEYSCRAVLFIEGRIKINSTVPLICDEDHEELCPYAAMLMYQYLAAFSEAPPVGSPDYLVDPIKDFGFASYRIDKRLSSISEKLDSAGDDPEQLKGALQEIRDSVPGIEDDILDLEDNLFGWNSKLSCDSEHWCLCPDIDLDQDALTEMDDLASSLLAKVGPYNDYSAVASAIHSGTNERLDYVEKESKATTYSYQFDSMDAASNESLSLGKQANLSVSNETLSENLARLNSLHLSIPANIESRDFSTTEEDIAEYKSLISTVRDTSTSLLAEYDDAAEAKSQTESIITLLETKNLDPTSVVVLNGLINETEALNRKFLAGPLTLEELDQFEENYSMLSLKGTSLLTSEKQEPASVFLSMFRTLTHNMNAQIADMGEQTDAFSASDVHDNPTMAFGLFSGSVFLSLFSLVLLLLLYILVSSKSRVPGVRQVVGALFLCSILVLVSVSALTFIFLQDTATDATFTEYLADFNERNASAIVVDSRNAPYSDAQSMDLCAKKLSNLLEESNRSWAIYSLTSETHCVESTPSGVSTLTTEECLSRIDGYESSIMVGYSETRQPMHFSIIYRNMAEIRADATYYDSCPFVALFSSGSNDNQS